MPNIPTYSNLTTHEKKLYRLCKKVRDEYSRNETINVGFVLDAEKALKEMIKVSEEVKND